MHCGWSLRWTKRVRPLGVRNLRDARRSSAKSRVVGRYHTQEWPSESGWFISCMLGGLGDELRVEEDVGVKNWGFSLESWIDFIALEKTLDQRGIQKSSVLITTAQGSWWHLVMEDLGHLCWHPFSCTYSCMTLGNFPYFFVPQLLYL